MRKIITYKIERDDPPWQKRIYEAFNRMISFAPELTNLPGAEPHPLKTVFNRIALNGEFTANDLAMLHSLAGDVNLRAMKRVQEQAREPSLGEYYESVVQAAENLTDTMNHFSSWVLEH